MAAAREAGLLSNHGRLWRDSGYLLTPEECVTSGPQRPQGGDTNTRDTRVLTGWRGVPVPGARHCLPHGLLHWAGLLTSAPGAGHADHGAAPQGGERPLRHAVHGCQVPWPRESPCQPPSHLLSDPGGSCCTRASFLVQTLILTKPGLDFLSLALPRRSASLRARNSVRALHSGIFTEILVLWKANP